MAFELIGDDGSINTNLQEEVCNSSIEQCFGGSQEDEVGYVGACLTCFSIHRFYVHRSSAQCVVRRLDNKVKKFPVTRAPARCVVDSLWMKPH